MTQGLVAILALTPGCFLSLVIILALWGEYGDNEKEKEE